MNTRIKRITSIICAAALLACASACSNSGGNNANTQGNQLFSEISQTNKAEGDSQAATLNNACKETYAGVLTGAIAKGKTKDASGAVINWGAAAGASRSECKNAANAITIEQAQAYKGTTISLDNMYYLTADDKTKHLTKGTIVYWDGQDSTLPVSDKSILAGPITNHTTLGEINKDNY